MQSFSYYIIYKPFGILSQFSPEGNKEGLGELYPFPKDVYPVGRLDADSEGLLILTNDKQLNHRLLNPGFRHWRTYWVQVDGAISQEASKQLEKGVSIKVNKKAYQTLPARAAVIEEPTEVPERNPPIRYRKDIPTSWLSVSLQEGKNRQVRRMTAAVGFPTLRLIRVEIENLSLHKMGLQPGEVKEIREEEIYQLLKLKSGSSPSRNFRRGKP